VNSFYLKPENEPEKINTGFWGLSAGVEYYYTDNRFVAFTGSLNSDIFAPFPAAVDYEGYYESMSSAYLSATHNHKIKRFYVGYGLNYSRNLWRWDDGTTHEPVGTMPPPPDFGRKPSSAIGITLNGYHQLSEHFMLGFIYRPTILRVSPQTEFKYEHLISFDIAWRIVLREGGNQ
jgi:hypothetical protein